MNQENIMSENTNSVPTSTKKTVAVAAALIVEHDKFLIAKRSAGRHLAGYWEFPGGKINEGESAAQACAREVKEELDCTISVDSYFLTCHHEYEDFILSMDIYVCHLQPEQTPVASEAHDDLRFITVDEMDEVEFAPADIAFLPNIKNFMLSYSKVSAPGKVSAPL